MHTDAASPDAAHDLRLHSIDSDPPADDLADDGDDEAPAARGREGLPKSYRSRHDRHYVEQLSTMNGMPLLRMLAIPRIDAANLPEPAAVTELTASIARLGVLQPLLVRAHGDRFVLIAGRKRLVAAREARLREVPCLVHTADEAVAAELAEAVNALAGEPRERVTSPGGAPPPATCDTLSDAVLPEIHHALTTVQRTLRLLPSSPAATRERVATRLIAAELERAQWLVRCRWYLASRLAVAPRLAPSEALLKEARGTAAAIALHGGTLDVAPTSLVAEMTADVPLLSATIAGLVWALLAIGETVGDASVRVSIDRADDGRAALRVTQPTAVLSQATLLRFFDAGWRGRPGGTPAELAVRLARYAAAQHGADLEVSSGAAGGTSVTLTMR